MAPLRFRAWFKGDPEMDAGPCMIQNVQLVYDGYNGGLTRQDDPNCILGGCSSFGTLIKDPNFIVMQSTGVKDKAGKEIFEGDVVKWKGYSGVVRWTEKCSSPGFYVNDFPTLQYPEWGWIRLDRNYEILGNAYQNLELLPA